MWCIAHGNLFGVGQASVIMRSSANLTLAYLGSWHIIWNRRRITMANETLFQSPEGKIPHEGLSSQISQNNQLSVFSLLLVTVRRWKDLCAQNLGRSKITCLRVFNSQRLHLKMGHMYCTPYHSVYYYLSVKRGFRNSAILIWPVLVVSLSSIFVFSPYYLHQCRFQSSRSPRPGPRIGTTKATEKNPKFG